MTEAGRYARIVVWSDEDGCYIGSCPELTYGGCHGDDPRAVFDELCQIVEEVVELYQQDGKPLPSPLTFEQIDQAIRSASPRPLTPSTPSPKSPG